MAAFRMVSVVGLSTPKMLEPINVPYVTVSYTVFMAGQTKLSLDVSMLHEPQIYVIIILLYSPHHHSTLLVLAKSGTCCHT